MDTLLHDLRVAIRAFAKTPGFAALTICTIALGVGATTAIFSVVDGVVLRTLPYPDPDRIVRVYQIAEDRGANSFSDANFADVREQSRSFEALAQASTAIVPASIEGEAIRAMTASVSRDFFRVMGVQPLAGRAFVEEEQRVGGVRAVVISHDYWRERFGGSREVVDRSIIIDGQPHRIVGAMPREFAFPDGAQLWVPRELRPVLPSRTAQNWRVYGRLRPNVSLEQANQEIDRIARDLKQIHGRDTWMTSASAVELREQLVGSVRPRLLLMLGAAGFLLIIACANVLNLLLARASARQRELAVRVALGATHARVLRQSLTEALVLAVAGGALGVVLAVWGVRALIAVEPGNLPRTGDIGVSWMTVVFAVCVSLLVAIVLGALAAQRVAGSDVRESLASGQRSMSGGRARNRARAALVVSQVALTVVLLIGAGLLGRSFLRLLAIDPGYRTSGAVVMSVAVPRTGEDDATRRTAFHDALAERLRAIPGVDMVGATSDFPLGGQYPNGTFMILRHPEEVKSFEDARPIMGDPERTGSAAYRVVSEDYFRAMGVPLIRGRSFSTSDLPDGAHVAVISESLASTRWAGQDPLGKFIQFGNMDGDLRAFTIVGVVGDIREQGIDADPVPTLYGYHRQRSQMSARMTYVITGDASPAPVMQAARAAVRDLDPRIPPNLRTLDEVFATSLGERRFSFILLGVFGAVALVLAVMGIYGVVSYLVAQRTREIGIRMALGARPGDVAGMVVRGGLGLSVAGVAVGVVAAGLLTRLMTAMLYDVEPLDAVTFISVPVLLAVAAAVASYVPARRAAGVEPVEAMRTE